MNYSGVETQPYCHWLSKERRKNCRLLEWADIFLVLVDNSLDLFAGQTDECHMGNGRLKAVTRVEVPLFYFLYVKLCLLKPDNSVHEDERGPLICHSPVFLCVFC